MCNCCASYRIQRKTTKSPPTDIYRLQMQIRNTFNCHIYKRPAAETKKKTATIFDDKKR